MRSRGSGEYAADEVSYSDDPENLESPKPGNLHKIIGAISILIVGSFFVNSTLAANISLNSGQSVEFGQGLTQTVACSGATNLIVTPNASFTNAPGGGGFYFSSVTVSNIPISCHDRDFIINAYDNSSSTPLALFNSTSTDAVVYNNAGVFQAGAGSTGMTVSSGSQQFTANFSAPVATTNSVFKVTLQSTANATVSCSLGGTCSVGDTGPGGGKVFYVNLAGFACGVTRSSTCRYSELAPTNWDGGVDPQISWAQSTPVDYRSTSLLLNAGIGYGALNTKAIIDQGNTNVTSSAAAKAAAYSPVVGGATVNDWYLPSENDWGQVWIQRNVIGFSASGGNYWSSTSTNSSNGRYFMFAGGTTPGSASGMTKGTSNQMYVRPARSF